jgi:hypothetical protein
MSKKVAASLLLTAVASSLSASSNSAQMSVSVQVIARTILTVDSQPASIDVTSADVSRGYIEVPQAVLFSVRSNAAGGYALQFQPVSFPFSRADIYWGNTSSTVTTDGSWMSHPYQQGMTSGALNVRLTLAPGTEPGTYAWPVHFEAGSL